MKRKYLILIVFVTLALFVGKAGAQAPCFIIYPVQLAEGEIVTVDAGQVVGVGVSWNACRIALVEVAARVSHINLWLDSQPWPPAFTTAATTGLEASANAEKEPFDCMGHTDRVYGFANIYGFGALEIGDHPVHIVWRFDHPVPTGADQDGDGRPEISRGTLLDRNFTIRVQAP
jgi:hypothetical protein